jgi:hypothetical protein
MATKSVIYELDPTIEYDDNMYKIIRKIYHTDKAEYKIYNYDDAVITPNDDIYNQYRSVIFSHPENHLLSFTTPKSICSSLFRTKYPELSNDIIVNEIIEGRMIHLFYDHRISSWEIATKSSIGGDYILHTSRAVLQEKNTNKTVLEMFFDACRTSTLQQRVKDINDIVFLEYLPKRFSYHFILRHPENSPFFKIERPELYLVEVYEIEHESTYCSIIPQREYQNWSAFTNLSGIIHFPRLFQETSYEELCQKYIHIHGSPCFAGLMITNYSTGERCALHNPVNLDLKKYYYTKPDRFFLYLCLRRIHKVDDYLSKCPKDKNEFYLFYEQYQQFAKNVHQSYIDCFVKKKNTRICDKYYKYIYSLHYDVYVPATIISKLNILSGKKYTKTIITRQEVYKYLLSVDPYDLLNDMLFDIRNAHNSF